MSELEVEQFERDATAFHMVLNRYFVVLKPTHSHYHALQQLHEALLRSVQDVTGREAYWCRVGPGRMPDPDRANER